MQLKTDYFGAYRGLKLTRDTNGVLVVEFHTNGGPALSQRSIIRRLSMLFTGLRKTERTRLVILTGAAGGLHYWRRLGITFRRRRGSQRLEPDPRRGLPGFERI